MGVQIMKLKKIIVLILCLTIILPFAVSCNNEPEEFHLTILHTNDWHGVLDNVPKYATMINEIRDEVENVLLLDGGDIYRRGPFQELDGAVEIAVMNALGYDALVFGNGEFPRAHESLYNLSEHTILQRAEFPVLLGNVTLNGEIVEGFEPYIILEFQGIQIAILGVTSPKPWDRGYPFTSRYEFIDPVVAVNQLVEQTSDISDIQIVLSHAGIRFDRMMRGVSAIIGGDDHRAHATPEVIYDGERRIPIVQAGGETNHYLGRLDLSFARVNGEWVLQEFNGRLLLMNDVTPDADIQRLIDYYRDLQQQEEAA